MPREQTEERRRSRSPAGQRICGLCNEPECEDSFGAREVRLSLVFCHIRYLPEDLQTLVRNTPNGCTRVILEDGLQWAFQASMPQEDRQMPAAVAMP